MFSRRLSVVLILSLIALAGCITPVVSPPDWITGVSQDNPEGTLIITYGRGERERDAREAAEQDGFRQIERLIIEELALEVPAAEVEATARRRAETVTELESYSRRDSSGWVEFYGLLLYRDLERSADLRTLSEAVVTLPQTTAEQSTPPSDPLSRLQALLEQDVPTEQRGRERIVMEALAVAERELVTIQPETIAIPLGEVTPLTFTVRVSTEGAPVAGLSLTVQVDGPEVDGERRTTHRDGIADMEGSLAVTPTVPRYSGNTVITAAPVWFPAAYSRWAEGMKEDGERDTLDVLASRLQGRATVRVTTQAAMIPTAVVILDRDIAGNPLTGSDAMTGVVRELAERGYRVRRVELSVSERERLARLERITVADLYDILPFDVLSSVDRAIVGDARITEFDETEGYSVGVELGALAFDLRRDRQLALVSVTERISGSSPQSAIRAAFQESGRRLARRMAPQLP